jgi:hypothetical protein
LGGKLLYNVDGSKVHVDVMHKISVELLQQVEKPQERGDKNAVLFGLKSGLLKVTKTEQTEIPGASRITEVSSSLFPYLNPVKLPEVERGNSYAASIEQQRTNGPAGQGGGRFV